MTDTKPLPELPDNFYTHESPWREILAWHSARCGDEAHATAADVDEALRQMLRDYARRALEAYELGARSTAAQPVERAVALLREAVTTLDMWADVAPAVSLRHDINRFLGSVTAASGDSTPPSEPSYHLSGAEQGAMKRALKRSVKFIDQGDPSGALRPAPEAVGQDSLSLAARDVLAERRRQIEVEGWTPEHDDEHDSGGMATAAACYAIADRGAALAVQTVRVEKLWEWTGWAMHWFKPKMNRRQNLVRAGALILAEIERLDRKAEPAQTASGCSHTARSDGAKA